MCACLNSARRIGWDGTQPVETRIVTLGATGLAREKGVAETERAYAFADLEGRSRPDWATSQAGSRGRRAARNGFMPRTRDDFAASETARRRSPSGYAGQLSRRVSERFKLRQDAYIAELELEPLCAGYKAARAALRYKPLSRFPAVERDFSLVLADGTTFARIEETIRALDIAEISSIDAVDLFRGKNMPEGKFALLVRVRFESHQATLTEAQLTDFSSRILAALEQKLGATLRA